MRASEDKKPEPKLDAYAKSADEQRKLEEQKRRMDLKNTPRDLHSQTTPERAGEVMNPPPQPPLSAQPKPSLANMEYPAPAQQTSPSKASPERPRPPATVQGQPTLSPSEADKTWQKKEPENQFFKNPLNYKGWEFIPSPHEFKIQKKF